MLFGLGLAIAFVIYCLFVAHASTLVLAATSNYNNRFRTPNIRGQVLRDAGPHDALPRQGRATIWVPASTPAFASAPPAYPLAVLNASMINHLDSLQSSILMSSVVQSIDVLVGEGNPGAVGFRMRGAQGSSLEDVAAFNPAGDAFAGIQGCSGSGGAHSNLTVSGFRIGFDARESQPAPTASNVRIFNSSCAGLLHAGLETLSMAGLHAQAGPMTQGPAVVGAQTGGFTGAGGVLPSEAESGGACFDKLPPSVNHQQAEAWQSGTLGLSEGRIEGSWKRAGVLQSQRSLYLRNVFVEGQGGGSRGNVRGAHGSSAGTGSYVAVEVTNATGPGSDSFEVAAGSSG